MRELDTKIFMSKIALLGGERPLDKVKAKYNGFTFCRAHTKISDGGYRHYVSINGTPFDDIDKLEARLKRIILGGPQHA